MKRIKKKYKSQKIAKKNANHIKQLKKKNTDHLEQIKKKGYK